jgi:hypothetical protein
MMSAEFAALRVAQCDMKLRPASSEREWISGTDGGFAKRCLPLLIANQAGWTIHSDRPVRAVWRGGTAIEDVVLEVRGDPPYAAASHFGHGILTFAIPFLFRTPPGTSLLFRGPANSPKDAIVALEGLVETDWSVATATMNWKFTRPNTWVEFAEDEAICMVVPQRVEILENMRPRILDLKENTAAYEGYRAWRKSRRKFLKDLRRFEPEALKRGWERHYFWGTAPADGDRSPTPSEHRTRLKLLEFMDEGAPVRNSAGNDSAHQQSNIPPPSLVL